MVEVRIGFRLVGVRVWELVRMVRVRFCAMCYIYESPHKDVRMGVCVCVCVIVLIS